MRAGLGVTELLDLDRTIARELFEGLEYPWEALGSIKAFVVKLSGQLDMDAFDEREAGVFVHRDANVAQSAYIAGPAIIDACAEIRHCAYIRGSVIVGKGAVIGNSTELKNSVIFDGAQAPHFNYVGDSVLGYNAHMGAGSILSNVKADKRNVTVNISSGRIETGLRKFGAILGDSAEIGCNAVLNPGTVIGRRASVYPVSNVRGVVPEDHIYKRAGVTEKRI